MFGLNLGTIRVRLLIAFVLIALMPAVGIISGSLVVGYVDGQRLALEQLESVSKLKERETQAWIDSLQNELIISLNEEYALERARVVLTLAEKEKYSDLIGRALRMRLQRFIEQSEQLELFLLDLQGRVVLSTDPENEGKQYPDLAFIQGGLASPQTQLSYYPNTGLDHAGIEEFSQATLSLITTIPIIGPEGQLWGVIAGRASVNKLNRILSERTGLGKTGKVYLVEDYYLVAGQEASTGGHSPPASAAALPVGIPLVHSTGIDMVMQNRANGSGVYQDYRGVQVLGVYHWIPELDLAILVEQDLSEAFGLILTTLRVNIVIAGIALLLAVAASLAITRGIASPLVNLVETASQITAGDLNRVAEIEREDEVGTLARAFNTMTAQLRDLINNLEQRVRDRTQALRQRAVQLETSAQVSRDITSILEIDDLLARVVELVREAFDYYHVQIFLLDRETRLLSPRASSSKAGSQLDLKICGKGLNSEAAEKGEPLLVNDVSEDSRYLADERLPNTRSELVVPLRYGGKVIGTLDVQSEQANTFTPQDVLLLQSLGDQVAIAIENARLYERSRELGVREERDRLARELHDSVIQSLCSLTLFSEASRRLVNSGQTDQAQQYLDRIGMTTRQALQEMRLLVYELRPPVLEREGLVGALRQRLHVVEMRSGMDTNLVVDCLPELPSPTEEALYRIAQEALNNVVKHAAATSVSVTIKQVDGNVELEITDNGRGFAVTDSNLNAGMGLKNIQERVSGLDGELTIHSAPGEGTSVRVGLNSSRNNSEIFK